MMPPTRRKKTAARAYRALLLGRKKAGFFPRSLVMIRCSCSCMQQSLLLIALKLIWEGWFHIQSWFMSPQQIKPFVFVQLEEAGGNRRWHLCPALLFNNHIETSHTIKELLQFRQSFDEGGVSLGVKLRGIGPVKKIEQSGNGLWLKHPFSMVGGNELFMTPLGRADAH